MRLLFISTDTRPAVGGIAKALYGWLSGLAELGHEVCIFSILLKPVTQDAIPHLNPRPYQEIWCAHPERLENPGDRFLLIRKTRSALFLLKRTRYIHKNFKALIEEFCPDIAIICVLNPICCSVLGELKRREIPVVSIAYGSEIHPARVQNPGWLKKILREFAFVIAISEFTKKLLLNWDMTEEQIKVVHPPLEPDSIKRARQLQVQTPSGEQSQGISENTFRLLTIARLVERKGVQTALHAVKLLADELPNLMYDIIGEGPYRFELERLANDLGIAERVKFHGLLSDPARDDFLMGCDVFIMTPDETNDGDVEGFGIVFIEAGLFGKPVIGSRSGGVPDAIEEGKTGMLVQPKNEGMLAKAILELYLDGELRHRLGKSGRVWAEDHFPEVSAAGMIQVFKSIKQVII